MKRTDSSLKPEVSYLLFLNDPVEFTRQQGVKDRRFLRYLQVRTQTMKLRVRERSEVTGRARKILQEMKTRLHADTVQDVVDALKDPGGLSDTRKLEAFVQRVSSGCVRGSIMRLFDDAFHQWGATRLQREERRAINLIARIAPLPRLRAIHARLQVCRLCEQFFIRDTRKQAQRAQQYCSTCRRRWSKMQLWYQFKKKQKHEELREAVQFQEAMENQFQRRQKVQRRRGS